jgi:Ca2+-transporting ATPase
MERKIVASDSLLESPLLEKGATGGPSSSSVQAEAWHAQRLENVLADLRSGESGLTQTEARARREQHGPNRLPRAAPATSLQIVMRQFRSPLIYVLGAAGIVSAAIGELTDAAFIAAVLAINAAIGAYQELRAEQSSRALESLLRIRAAVLRDGEVREIDAEDVVPGDIVWVEPGNRIPADSRLVSAHGLEVDESLLTGESLAVLKDLAR